MLTATYETSRSDMRPWCDGANAPFDPVVKRYLASHNMIIKGCQGVCDWREDVMRDFMMYAPKTIRVAHILTRLHDAQPDPTTHYGRYAIAVPRTAEYRLLTADHTPGDYIDMAHRGGDALIDFIHKEVVQKRIDGEVVWHGVDVDFYPEVPWDLDWAANGYASQFECFAAWKEAHGRWWRRLQRLVPAGYLLMGNMNAAAPPGVQYTMIEGWPDQVGHGSLDKILALTLTSRVKPALFAATDGRGGPGAPDYLRHRDFTIACAAYMEGVAIYAPGETTVGNPEPWWTWPPLPRLNLGKTGPRDDKLVGGWLTRSFQYGTVSIEPTKRYGVIAPR